MTEPLYVCPHCLEDVLPKEPHIETDDGASRVHLECMIRMTVGTIAHQERRCSCYGGTEDGDPPGLSPREAARQAACFFIHGSTELTIDGKRP